MHFEEGGLRRSCASGRERLIIEAVEKNNLHIKSEFKKTLKEFNVYIYIGNKVSVWCYRLLHFAGSTYRLRWCRDQYPHTLVAVAPRTKSIYQFIIYTSRWRWCRHQCQYILCCIFLLGVDLSC